MKRFLTQVFALFAVCLIALVAIFGSVVFAASNDSTPATPIATAVAIPTNYATVLGDLHYGKGYCFFDGSFKDTTSQSCDTNIEPPPATPAPSCSDVQTGGILSPNLAHIDFADGNGNGIAYLFQSQQCGAVWAGFDTKAGNLTVNSVEIRETVTNRGQFQYLGNNRPTGAGDWTSTYMMSYIPKNTYCVDVSVDGKPLLPEQCATV